MNTTILSAFFGVIGGIVALVAGFLLSLLLIYIFGLLMKWIEASAYAAKKWREEVARKSCDLPIRPVVISFPDKLTPDYVVRLANGPVVAEVGIRIAKGLRSEKTAAGDKAYEWTDWFVVSGYEFGRGKTKLAGPFRFNHGTVRVVDRVFVQPEFSCDSLVFSVREKTKEAGSDDSEALDLHRPVAQVDDLEDESVRDALRPSDDRPHADPDLVPRKEQIEQRNEGLN